MYKLSNRFLDRYGVVSVVGCGGTGGFVAEGLCRLLVKDARILLIDYDRVEESNLGRSNFTRADIGQFKSEVLAWRLSGQCNRPIAYSTLPVGAVPLPAGLVIGCVDNGPARLQIERQLQHPVWWIDSGNGQNYGQILIGDTKGKDISRCFDDGICSDLPLPTVQRPELLAQEPGRRNCDEAVARNEQGPTINQAMATLVLEVVRRIIEGTCTWMQLYLDLDAGTLHPVNATPEIVAKITGVKISHLIAKKGGDT